MRRGERRGLVRNQMHEIVVEGDGQFPTDVRVPIIRTQLGVDRSLTITAGGTHRTRNVGLELTVQSGMKPGVVGDEIDKTAFYSKGIVMRGIGAATRGLARADSRHDSRPRDAPRCHHLHAAGI